MNEPFKGFWNRLHSFVENVQVSDAMSEEEKCMILSVCNDQTEVKNLAQPVVSGSVCECVEPQYNVKNQNLCGKCGGKRN